MDFQSNRHLLALTAFAQIFAALLVSANARADTLSDEIPTWTKQGMLKGASSTEKECVRSDRVWVADEGNGFCIRYFTNEIKAKSGLAIVVFDGDYVASEWDWSTGLPIRPIYSANISGAPLFRRTRDHTRKSKDNLLIFIGRPGQLGSSGDHKEKYKPFESRVVNGALDQIKERHDIKSFVLTGQSGGATLVANLLPKRQDIKCAVMASGAVALRSYAFDHKFDASIWKAWEDPLDSAFDTKPSDAVYYVLAGSGDKIRPPRYQKMFANALASESADVHFVAVHKPNDPHNLQDEAIEMANRCANGGGITEVISGLNVIDRPEFVGNPDELKDQLKNGDRALVRRWQQYFQLFGHYQGHIDGVYGNNTSLAIHNCMTDSLCSN